MTVLSVGSEIATYLQSVTALSLNFSGTGTINCFVSVLPDQPNQAVAIYERGGLGPVMVLTGSSGPESKLDRAGFQVRVRADMTNYTAGQNLAQGIYGALQGIVETKINGSSNQLFHLIQAISPPAYIGRDDKQRHEFSQQYYAWFENGAR